MDYKQFFSEVADWVLEVNSKASSLGMDSDGFWKWIMQSSAAISERYENNKLVVNQMVMLVDWVQDIYRASKEAAG
ncbi:hypothetical protein E4665_17795 [Sporolactobacillus shoreae]|uniref:Uncharacterized protein n=1 Tax=Sporolactobacillus shoreae TaxID=1465501 RepID=A0A4Z0GGH8_9BACL|nr:hypothetical protein [Sporolactobacillus shoreae]TGA95626.1 hypothetical protein E4665_17795 [Sporolactobacillus shoreae]